MKLEISISDDAAANILAKVLVGRLNISEIAAMVAEQISVQEVAEIVAESIGAAEVATEVDPSDVARYIDIGEVGAEIDEAVADRLEDRVCEHVNQKLATAFGG